MDNFSWMTIKYTGNRPMARANFGSTLVGSKLVIFGGINEKLLPSNKICMIEFNQKTVEEIVQREKEEKERKRISYAMQ